MKKLVHALVLTGLVSAPALAIAEDSPHSISANVSLTSDYVFRGISQTGGDPAIQGGFDYAHSSGFYAGTWASNVGWIEDFQGYGRGNMEIDFYAGFGGSMGDFTYDVGGIYYYYPGERYNAAFDFTPPSANTTEVYVSGGWKWFTVKYSYYLSDDVFGIASDGGDYWDISASYPVGETGLTLDAHWGTFGFDKVGEADYDDWSIGASYDMGKLGKLGDGVTVAVKYTDTNADKVFWSDFPELTNGSSQYLGDNAFIFSVSKSF
jgi:uncharacterized protein (TIGR02001 family)